MAPRPHHRSFKHALAAAATLALAVSAAACANSTNNGGTTNGRSLAQPAGLLLQAQSALATAAVVRIKGTIVQESASGTDSLTVDATSAGKSGTSQGTLDLEGPGLGFTGSTLYVIVGSSTWVNGTTAFWHSYFGKQTATVSRLEAKVFPELVGHWIELLPTSTETMYKDALGLSEPKVFVAATMSGLKGTLTNSGTQSVNGASGVQISSSTGSKILVDASGAPLPIELADVSHTSGTFTLDIAVSYPPGATIAAPTHFALLSSVLKAGAAT